MSRRRPFYYFKLFRNDPWRADITLTPPTKPHQNNTLLPMDRSYDTEYQLYHLESSSIQKENRQWVAVIVLLFLLLQCDFMLWLFWQTGCCFIIYVLMRLFSVVCCPLLRWGTVVLHVILVGVSRLCSFVPMLFVGFCFSLHSSTIYVYSFFFNSLLYTTSLNSPVPACVFL